MSCVISQCDIFHDVVQINSLEACALAGTYGFFQDRLPFPAWNQEDSESWFFVLIDSDLAKNILSIEFDKEVSSRNPLG